MDNQKVIKFIENRKILFAIPIAIVVITVIVNIILGLEVAIEFKGGTMLTYSYTGEIDTNAVQATVEAENHGAVKVTTGSALNSSLETVQISFASSEGLTAEIQTDLTNKLQKEFKENSLVLVDSQDVNPTSGFEFFLKCMVAVLFSFVLLVIYIAFRFKKIGGLSAGVFALVALMHDIFIVYAVFVYLRFPIDANFMAVVLTTLGNSINNTIVVYDRVRENRTLYGTTMPLRDLVNLSITQSVKRSINTTLTTGIAVLSICVVCAICGVTSIMSFAIPMVVGLVFGTYSSLCISGPLWVLWQEKFGKSYTDKDDRKKSNNGGKKASTVRDTKKLMV
ncbi:MAG: protein translocase subunit SecF [Eubacterium sp.]|nr:protein translocase subunit SecF [Eubacterium sp.]